MKKIEKQVTDLEKDIELLKLKKEYAEKQENERRIQNYWRIVNAN